VVRTALNTGVSWWRRRRREVGLDGQDCEHASPASQDGAYQRGLDTDLVAALRRLPVRQREVVALRLLLDLDTASAAEALGLADGTVGSHLHRALANLRCQLDIARKLSAVFRAGKSWARHLLSTPGCRHVSHETAGWRARWLLHRKMLATKMSATKNFLAT